jgi:glucan endo-1,3-alpha-glucosidase
MFRHHGKAVISTFSGENSLFGQPSLDLAWSFVKNSLEKYVPVSNFELFLTKLNPIIVQ